MKRIGEDVALAIAFAAVVAVVLWISTGLSPVARLAPLVVAVPTLLLLGLELLRLLRRAAVHPGAEAEALRRREWRFLVWMGVLLACSDLLGMTVGLPVFVLMYLRVRSGESWAIALGTAAGFWLVLFGVVSAVLRVPLNEGRVMSWMRTW